MYILSESSQNHSQKPTAAILVTVLSDVMPSTLPSWSHDPESPVPCTPKLLTAEWNSMIHWNVTTLTKSPSEFHFMLRYAASWSATVRWFVHMNERTNRCQFRVAFGQKTVHYGKKKLHKHTRLHDSCTRMYHCTTAYMAAAGFPNTICWFDRRTAAYSELAETTYLPNLTQCYKEISFCRTIQISWLWSHGIIIRLISNARVKRKERSMCQHQVLSWTKISSTNTGALSTRYGVECRRVHH